MSKLDELRKKYGTATASGGSEKPATSTGTDKLTQLRQKYAQPTASYQHSLSSSVRQETGLQGTPTIETDQAPRYKQITNDDVQMRYAEEQKKHQEKIRSIENQQRLLGKQGGILDSGGMGLTELSKQKQELLKTPPSVEQAKKAVYADQGRQMIKDNPQNETGWMQFLANKLDPVTFQQYQTNPEYQKVIKASYMPEIEQEILLERTKAEIDARFPGMKDGALKTSLQAIYDFALDTKGTLLTLGGVTGGNSYNARKIEMGREVSTEDIVAGNQKADEMMQKGAEAFGQSALNRQAIAGDDVARGLLYDIVKVVPDMAVSVGLAIATGGTGTAAQLTGKEIAKGLLKKETREAALKAVGKSLTVNPSTVPMGAKIFAQSYQSNLQEGMDEGQAFFTALVNAYGQSVLEGGGVQKALQEGGLNKAVDFLKSAMGEGFEEVKQNWWEGAVNKLVGGKDIPIYAQDKNQEAIFNPARDAYSAVVGAAAGGMGGAVRVPGAVKAYVDEKTKPKVTYENPAPKLEQYEGDLKKYEEDLAAYEAKQNAPEAKAETKPLSYTEQVEKAREMAPELLKQEIEFLNEASMDTEGMSDEQTWEHYNNLQEMAADLTEEDIVAWVINKEAPQRILDSLGSKTAEVNPNMAKLQDVKVEEQAPPTPPQEPDLGPKVDTSKMSPKVLARMEAQSQEVAEQGEMIKELARKGLSVKEISRQVGKDVKAYMMLNGIPTNQNARAAWAASTAVGETVVKGMALRSDKSAPVISNEEAETKMRNIPVLKNATVATDLGIGHTYVQKLGKRLGIDVIFYEGGPDAAEGLYSANEGRTVFINRKDADTGQATMRIMGHEFTHSVKQNHPELYKTLREVVGDTMTQEKVKNLLDRYKLDPEYQAKLAEDQESLIEEMLADEAGSLFTDKQFWNNVYEKDATVAQRLVKILRDLIDRILGTKAESGNLGIMTEMQLKEFQKKFEEAVADIMKGGEYVEGVQVDTKSGSAAPLYSVRTWTPESKEDAAKGITKQLNISREKALKWLESVDNAMAIVLNNVERLDYEPNPNYTALKENQDYGKSFDFSTLCKKRLLLQGTIEAIQKKQGRALSVQEYFAVRKALLDAGKEVSCGICYVDTRRSRQGQYANEFIDKYPDLDPELFLSQEGFDRLFEEHPEVYKELKTKLGSSAKIKMQESRTEYRGEIRKMTKVGVRNLNAYGGLRWQSWSDFEVPHLLDAMQAIADMSSVGLMGFAYTKMPNFALAMGNTGMMINTSLIPLGDTGMKDGKPVFDPAEGMDFNEAIKLRSQFSNTVGTTVVGINDEHIRALMAMEEIDNIIPYHISGLSAENRATQGQGFEKWKDYTTTQNESVIDWEKNEAVGGKYHEDRKKQKPKKPDISDWWDYTKTPQENQQAYLELCEEWGLRPKFEEFSNEENYWKLLTEYKMVNNEGQNIQQETVKPIFDDASIAKIMNEYEGGHRNLPVDKNVVKDFDPVQIKYSTTRIKDKDTKGNTISREQQVYFAETKAQKAGKLIRLYHGTAYDNFNEIYTETPFYLSEDRDYASVYISDEVLSDNPDLNGRIMEGYALIKNPLNLGEINVPIDDDYELNRLSGLLGVDVSLIKNVQAVADEPYFTWGITKTAEFKRLAESRGYDGYKATENGKQTWAVFDSNQFKSANNYSPTTVPDIRFSTRKDYGMNHHIGYYPDEISRANDISRDGLMIPKNVYQHPEWYFDMSDPATRQSWAAVLKIKGNPDAKVRIYRGVPGFVNEINEGDWISLSPIYAKGETREGGKVISNSVFADEIIWDGNSINEFAYFSRGEQKALDESGTKFKIKAYHGTPHDFDQFSTEAIGTGEGAQAYGWGLYFAGNKGIAEWYRDRLSSIEGPEGFTIKGVDDVTDFVNNIKVGKIKSGPMEEIAVMLYDLMSDYGMPLVDAIDYIKDDVEDDNLSYFSSDMLGKIAEFINDDEKMSVFESVGNKGKLFEVDLAPEVEHMLDWDKPRKQQSEYVQERLSKAFEYADEEYATALKAFRDYDKMLKDKYGDDIEARTDAEEEEYVRLNSEFKKAKGRKVVKEALTHHNSTGAEIYRDIIRALGSDKDASIFLHSLGIPGIKYLDGTSRGKGEGDYNYVVFDDAAVEVLDKYSVKRQPTGKPSVQVILDEKKAPIDLPGRLKDLYRRVVDKNAPLSKTDAKVARLASNAALVSGTIEWIAERELVDTFGDTVGKSLKETVKPFADNKDFWEYMAQRHNIDRAREGKPVDPDMTSEQSAAYVAQVETQHPEYKAWADSVTSWIDQFMQKWAVDTGIIDADVYTEWRAMYPSYFPTYREFSELEKDAQMGPGKRFVDLPRPVKRATGSDRDITNPVGNIVQMMNKVVRTARYNEVGRALYDTVVANPTATQKYAEEIPANVGMFSKLDNVVTVWVGGKPQYLQINDKALLESLEGMPKIINNAAAVRKVTKIYKGLITQYNPMFALRNMFRDIPTAYVYGSQHNPLFFLGNLAKAGYQVATKSGGAKKYMALGGGGSGQFSADSAAQYAKLLQPSATKNPLIRGGRGLLKAIEFINNVTEQAPRVSEFNHVLNKTGSIEQALYAAQNVTVNFARGGDVAKQIEPFVPYFNASVQGLDRFFQAFNFKKDPKGALLRMAKAGILVTAPQLASYMLSMADDEERYKMLDQRTKDAYYVFPKGDGTYLKIPKSRELGVLFASLFDRALSGNFEGFLGTVATNFTPVDPFTNNLAAPLVFNLPMNKDFAGRDIVPQYMLSDGRSPELQYDDNTSEIAKKIGELANLSPKQIDYLIRSYTGMIGQFLLPATTERSGAGTALERMTINTFEADPAFSSQAITDFYNKLSEYQQAKTDKNLKENIPSKEVTPEERLYNAMNKVASNVSTTTKYINANLKADDPKVRELRELVNSFVIKANKAKTVADIIRINAEMTASLRQKGVR